MVVGQAERDDESDHEVRHGLGSSGSLVMVAVAVVALLVLGIAVFNPAVLPP
jgi:hypothetical protein